MGEVECDKWDLKGEKDDVIVWLFQQDRMACHLERDWKLNFMLLLSTSLLTFCMVSKFA